MPNQEILNYIAAMPVGDAGQFVSASESEQGAAVVEALPAAVVTGSNLLEFSGDTTPVVRSAVALSLLAAQRVATNDEEVMSPDAWIDRHNSVLQNLNWMVVGGGSVEKHFDNTGVTVHKAILPFLTAAFGGAVAAGSLIITALQQLQEVNAGSPWITLFERESARFNVSEFQFTTVETSGGDTVMNMAAARFDATYGRTQVLFFKLKQQNAHFQMSNTSMRASNGLLADINAALKAKLAAQANEYIESLDL